MVGEAQRVRPSARGHLYFELVEKGRGDQILGKLDAVVWRTQHTRLRRNLRSSGQQIADGQQLRCRGRVDFWSPGGRLQFVIQDVDPLFTLGHLERRRRETLEALAKADLLDRNRQVPLPSVPLRIGLVTSKGSAAFHDFLASLNDCEYAFEVLFVHAATQGREAEQEIVSALNLLGDRGGTLDAIVLVRGGGARSDLAVFDSRAIAEAIAHCSRPVLTGLGHEIDLSIADRVGHAAFKTPTMVAEFLVGRAAEADHRVLRCEETLARLAREKVRRAEERLQSFGRLASLARLRLLAANHATSEVGQALARVSRHRLDEADRRLGGLERRLLATGPRSLERQREQPEHILRRIVDLANGRLRQAETRLDGMERLCQELSPERLLERGFSLTQTAAGDILRHPDQVRSGDSITTRVAGGTLTSRVEDS